MLKKFLGAATVLALMAPVGVLAASPASAAGGTSCSKQTGTATIKPGLGETKKDQTITATTNISGCSGAVKSGKGTATIKVKKGDCAGLGQTGKSMPISETIKWNKGPSSKFTGTSKTGPKVGQATISGKITSGQFKNLKVSTIIAFTPAANGGSCTDAAPLKKLTIKGVKPFAVK